MALQIITFLERIHYKLCTLHFQLLPYSNPYKVLTTNCTLAVHLHVDREPLQLVVEAAELSLPELNTSISVYTELMIRVSLGSEMFVHLAHRPRKLRIRHVRVASGEIFGSAVDLEQLQQLVEALLLLQAVVQFLQVGLCQQQL